MVTRATSMRLMFGHYTRCLARAAQEIGGVRGGSAGGAGSKPACHSTAKSNRPSTRITDEKLLTNSQANNPPLERGNQR